MFRLLPSCSKVIRSKNVSIIGSYHFIATKTTPEIEKDVTSSRNDSIPTSIGAVYVKVAVTLIITFIGFRFVSSLLDERSNKSFGDTFKSHAFSWPQHYNIFLPQNRLDVNDEDDEISVDDF